jgi:hypothetical protein
VKQKAQEEVARREAEAAAAEKAQQEAQRRQLAEEALRKRQVGSEAGVWFKAAWLLVLRSAIGWLGLLCG